jgi:hypothetical protein
MINISIFGSCVTRDAFSEFAVDFKLIDYYARSSFASLSFKAYKGGAIDLTTINSGFQRRMINRDSCKSFWDFIQIYNDILVVDFTDDRFPLIEFQDGSALTLSAELGKVRKSIPNFIHAKSIDPFSLEYFEKWKLGWEKFVDLMKRKGNLDNVIINKAFWATKDNHGIELPNQNMIYKANEHHLKVYETCARDLPESQFICYPNHLFVASSEHKWGNAPFHFIDELYLTFLDQLRIAVILRQ